MIHVFIFFLMQMQGYLPEALNITRQVHLKMGSSGVLFGEVDLMAGTGARVNGEKIVVADHQSDLIFVFDKKTGAYETHFVKKGGGPDELGSLGGFGLSEKYLAVIDLNKPSTYNIYKLDGEFVKKVRVEGPLIENNPLEIFKEKYLVTPYTFRSSFSVNTRVAVWDLFSGKLVKSISRSPQQLDCAVSFQTVDCDENHLWIPLALTRVFEKYDQELELIDQINMPFVKGSDTIFEVSEFNSLYKKKPIEAWKYFHNECRIPSRFFISESYNIVWNMEYGSHSWFSIYDKDSGVLLRRFRYAQTRLDGPRVPFDTDGDAIVFYKESNQDDEAGIVTFAKINF